MGPMTLKAFENLAPWEQRVIASARHTIVKDEMYWQIRDISQQAIDERDVTVPIRFDFPLPADCNVIEIVGGRHEAAIVLVKFKAFADIGVDAEHMTFVNTTDERVLIGTLTENQLIFGCAYEGEMFNSLDGMPETEVRKLSKIVAHIGHLFTLMAMPRLVKHSKPSMFHRHRAKKKLGRFYPLSWSNVSWEIGGHASAKEVSRDTGQKMPKHEVREHYRYVGRRTANSEFKFFPSHGYGYYTKVKPHTRGDEAYGVKLGRLTPTLRAGQSGMLVQTLKVNALLAATEAMQAKAGA